MDYIYKVEMTIDEKKVLSDGHKLEEVYKFLDMYGWHDDFVKERSVNVVSLSTMNKDRCGRMWRVISSAYHSWLKPYFKSMMWYIKPFGVVEDILAEWDPKGDDFVYKAELFIDEEKAANENMNICDIYAALDSFFEESFLRRKKEGSKLSYYTDMTDKIDELWNSVVLAYGSTAGAYIKSGLWYNGLIEYPPEDIAEKLAIRKKYFDSLANAGEQKAD